MSLSRKFLQCSMLLRRHINDEGSACMVGPTCVHVSLLTAVRHVIRGLVTDLWCKVASISERRSSTSVFPFWFPFTRHSSHLPLGVEPRTRLCSSSYCLKAISFLASFLLHQPEVSLPLICSWIKMPGRRDNERQIVLACINGSSKICHCWTFR